MNERDIREIVGDELDRRLHPCRVQDLSPEELKSMIVALRPKGSAGQKFFHSLFRAQGVEGVDRLMQHVLPIIQHGGALHPDDITNFLNGEREIYDKVSPKFLSRRHALGAIGMVGGLGYMGVGAAEMATRGMGINQEEFPEERGTWRRGVQLTHQGIRNVMPEVNAASGTVAVVAGYKIASSAKLQEVADAISQLSRLARNNEAQQTR